MSPAWSLGGAVVAQGGRRVLDGADLTVRPGEVVGLLGPNGSGKTTLLRAGLGLLKLEAGEARLDGSLVSTLSDPARAALAGYLPQDRRIAWNLSAARLVALGAPALAPAAAVERAYARLADVELAHLADRGVLEISGGERARVLIARLLATHAPLLVADEPIAGLDPDAQLLVLDLLRREADRGAAVVISLHDLGLAARACDRLVVLKAGRTVAEGPPLEVLTPELLRSVFGLQGEMIAGPDGPHLAVRRAG